MKFERFINSKFFKFIDWLYKLIILNVLTIITTILGLVIFGLVPSLVTLTVCIKTYLDKKDFSLFKGYFKTFFKVFKKTILHSVIYLIIILIQASWVFYFYSWIQEIDNFIMVMLYYLSLVLFVVEILAFINSIYLYVYFPYLNKLKILKYSFTLLIAISWKALILLGLLIGFLYLGVLIVYFVPLILISTYFFVGNLLVRNDYKKLIKEGETSLEVDTLKCQSMN